MRSCIQVFVTALALILCMQTGSAWEAATTHAGLTEQAAMRSSLHVRLRDAFGLEQGLFAALTVPPADAPELFKAMRALNPTHGHVPDSRGRLLALGWLAAGAVLADMPPAHAAHHFFDPLTGLGLTDETLASVSSAARHRLQSLLASESVPGKGKPAPAWVVDEQNPMNLSGFMEQYAKAVAARTPAERARHMAGALLAAGAMLHVLQDMGSPSHVRNDLAAHIEVIGNDAGDVGSRFERIAALAFGRLGVPAPAQVVSAASLEAFFTARDQSGKASGDRASGVAGLAERTAQRFFSVGTLPRPMRIKPGADPSTLAQSVAKSLMRPHPAPLLAGLDLVAARESAGAKLVDDQGVCVANYQIRDNILRWYMDDECMAEQAAVLLPEVAAYSAGLIDWLFRGTIAIEPREGSLQAIAQGAEFGAGQVELFWDDGQGVRTRLGEPIAIERAAAGEPLVTLDHVPKLPPDVRAIAVLYRGVDQANQPLQAAGYLSLARAKSPAKR